MNRVKKLMARARRRIAVLLVVVMTLQALLTSVNVVAMAAPSGPEPENNIFALKGSPEEAFDYIYVQLGKTVSGEGDELSVTYWYRLNNLWLEEQFEKYLADGLADPYSFEFDDTCQDMKQTYGSYDNYLLEQLQVPIAAPSFTCSFDDGFADMEELMTLLSADSGLYTEKGELIGEVTAADANGPQFHIQFNNTIFARQNIYGNKGMAMKLLYQYDTGTKVEAETGSGENSLEVIINGEGIPLATDSNYTIEKDFQQGADVDGANDPSAINFHITAKATPSAADLSTASDASPGSAPRAGVVTASSSTADQPESRSGTDDDDDLPEDARDITLEYDWWNLGRKALKGMFEDEEGGGLNGKYITDAISSNLTLDAAAVSYDGGLSWTFLSAADYGYADWEAYLSDHNRLFAYQIEGGGENPVWRCEVILYTRIADKLWRQYAQTGTLHCEFPNRAVLKAGEDSGTLAVSDKVKPEIHWYDMISKNGRIVDINGNKMRWNIHADAHFSAGVQLYLVDHIADIANTHNYIWDENGQGTITINGDEQMVVRLTLTDEILAALAERLGVDAADIWTELRYGAKDEDKGLGEARYGMPSVSTIEALLELLPEASYNDGSHYAYEYTYKNEDGETVTDAVMLISMKNDTEGKTTITYDTEVTAVPDAATGAYDNVVLGNDVRPVWKWDQGGPGEMPTGEINVDKIWNIRTDVVNKSGAGYDDATNTIDWVFDINQTGKKLDDVRIEDPLDTKILAWTGLVGAQEPLRLVPYIRSPEVDENDNPIDEEVPGGTVRQVSYVSPEDYESRKQGGEDDCYTVVTQTGADGAARSILKVHLGPVGADEYYKLRVQTLVVNPHYAQGENLLITNEGTATVMIDGKESEPVELWAEETLLHNLIDKDAVSFEDGSNYNYEDNTVKWRVLLNPKKFTISDATVTDTLPLGTKFAEVTGVTVDGENVEWEYAGSGNSRRIKIKDSDVGISLNIAENQAPYPGGSSGRLYSSDTLVMRFINSAGSGTDISRTYGLEYTTTVTGEFRKDIIKSNGKAETLYNYVKLDGKIDGAAIAGAESGAKHKIQPQALLKEGKYHGLSDYTYYYYENNNPDLKSLEMKAVYFNWQAYINRLGENLAGVTVSDPLASCFELVPATFRAEVVELDAAGREKAAGPVIIDHGKPVPGQAALRNLQLDEYGFSFEVPAEYADKTLKLTYDTILADDAAAAEMKNAIDVKGTGWEDSTGEVTDQKAEDFRYSDYNNADGMYFLRVEKISTNDDRDKLYLPGAEFTLTRMQLKSGAPSDVANWEESNRVKTRITNSSGVLNFLFIEPNTLYKLEETGAPAGYELRNKSWYIAILDGTYGMNGATAANKNNFPSEGLSADGSYEVILVNDPEDIGPIHYKNLEIDNNPGNEDHTNELVFRKLGQNGRLLPGIRFVLIGPHMILSTSSNAEGEVRFERLDPLSSGYYTLTEATVPEGYEQPGNWRVYVTLEQGKYQIVLKEQDETGAWVEVSEKATDSNWLLRNEPIMRGGSFTKVDQNGDKLSAFPVTFHVYRRGDGGTKEADGSVTVGLGNNSGSYKKYLKRETVSSSGGIVTLPASDFYYGYYRLNEVWDPVFHAEKPEVPVYLKIDKSGVSAAKAGKIPSSDADYTIDLQTPAALKAENVIQWGLVDVNKVLAAYHSDTKEWEADQDSSGVIRLADMLFAVYRVNNGQRESSPFMYIKTNAQGKFEVNASGQYAVYNSNGAAAGKYRSLLIGTYELKEWKNGEYIENTNYYPFEITGGEFDAQGNYTPNDPVVVSTQDNNDGYFLNKPVRFPVKLKKVDQEYPELALKNSEFEVRTGAGTLVARLVYENGTYGLAMPGLEPERDDIGRKYLELTENGEYALLAGTYTIIEIVAPDETYTDANPAYQIPDSTMTATLKISASGAQLTGGKLKQENAADTMVNSVKEGEFKLGKAVLVLQKPTSGSLSDTGTYEYASNTQEAAGFVFTLSGWSLPAAAAGAEKKTYTEATDTAGNLTFTKIPVGTYKLEETDVPADYKIGSGAEWIVEKVDPIWVKITAKDNTSDETAVTFYKDENCTELLDTDVPAETASQSDSSIGTNAEESLLAYNALKTADVDGVKETFYTDKHGEVKEKLAGVKFKLTHKSLGYEFECMTGSDGRISFKNIPYGTYTLTETVVPESYYRPVSFAFTISEATVDAGGVYHLKQNEQQAEIRNEVLLANAKFAKLDQNGNKITAKQLPLPFTVKRISESITGYPFMENEMRTYEIDNDGYLNITNLGIGVYEVTEDLSNLTAEQKEFLTAGAGPVHFWIEVKASPPGQVKVSVYEQKPAGLFRTIKAHATVAHKGTADFTTAEYADIIGGLMKNVRAYGMVNLNKVRGEWLADHKYEVTEQALAGVKFAIYEADEAGNRKSDTPFIILATNAGGSFPWPGTDGIYEGTDENNQKVSKALLAGYYVMQEWSSGEDYVLLPDDIPFTVLDQQTTWFYTDTGGKVTATASDAAETSFINVPKRGSLSFDKVDGSSGKYLPDAEFAVYLQGAGGEAEKPVGIIRYHPAAKTYQIVEAVNPAVLNANGIPYLVKDQAGAYHLLAGSYMIKETTAPAGYQLLTDGIQVIIQHGRNTAVTYPLSAKEGTVANGIQRASVAFVKKVEANPSRPEVTGNGTTFILRGTPANGDTAWEEKTFTAAQLGGENGRFDIAGLPLGSYALYEQAADPNSYQGFGGAAEAKILEIAVTAGANGIPEVAYTAVDTTESGKSPAGITVIIRESGAAGNIEIINNWKRGSVTGRKVAADNHEVGLSGAVFGLYTDADCTSLAATATSSTAAEPEGGFIFTDIAYGTYYVKEIKAPAGYAPSTLVYQVTVDTQEASVTEGGKLDDQKNAGEPEAILFTNGNKRGAVELIKKAAHNGELLADSAEFTIYADEACNEAVAYLRDGDRDGIYTLSGGSGLTAAVNGVRYLQADENGRLLLIQGAYWLKETKVPAGYQAEMVGGSRKVYEFTIRSEDDVTTQLLDTYVISNGDKDEFFYNTIATGEFTLQKTIEVSRTEDLTAADAPEAGAGFWFEIAGTGMAANEFLRIDGNTLAEAAAAGIAEETGDGSIRVVTGSGGTVVISGLLTGTYTVTETDGPNYDWYTGTAPKQVVLKQSEDKAEIITMFDHTAVDPGKEKLTFHNVLKRSNIKGLKVNTGGLGLSGAVIGLFPADTTEFTEVNLYQGKTAVSDANGSFVFRNVPYGTYRIAELTAPGGYRLNTTTSYLVPVTENDSEITAGYKEEKLETEMTVSEIKIVNSKTSTGGGGGGGGGGGNGGGGSTSTITGNDVPLGEAAPADDSGGPSGTLYPIDENGVPLAGLPITGDNLPYALLAAVMLGALGGIGIMVYRRKKRKSR